MMITIDRNVSIPVCRFETGGQLQTMINHLDLKVQKMNTKLARNTGDTIDIDETTPPVSSNFALLVMPHKIRHGFGD